MIPEPSSGNPKIDLSLCGTCLRYMLRDSAKWEMIRSGSGATDRRTDYAASFEPAKTENEATWKRRN